MSAPPSGDFNAHVLRAMLSRLGEEVTREVLHAALDSTLDAMVADATKTRKGGVREPAREPVPVPEAAPEPPARTLDEATESTPKALSASGGTPGRAPFNESAATKAARALRSRGFV